MTQAGLNLIQQAISIYDSDLRLVICNSRFREMFELPEALTTPGARFADTIRNVAERGDYGKVGNLDQYVQERVDQARAFEPHYVERTRRNGHVISIEGSPLQQGGWVTVYTDITAIKRQEALLRNRSEHLSDQLLGHSEDLSRANRELAASNTALAETKRQLTASEALARSTAEMMPAHIAHLDLSQRYTYSNRQLRSLLPDSPAEIVGKPAEVALGTDAFRKIKPYLDRAYRGEASVFEFSHSDDAQRIRVAFTPGRDSDGRVSGVYVMSTDITEEAQARAALMQSHKRTLAAQLTSGLAHDFANLLTIILGLQGRLGKLPDLPQRAEEMIATTRAAALRGGVLLDRLSNASGQRDIRPVSTDLVALFAEIRALASPTLPPGTFLMLDCTAISDAVVLDGGFLQDSLLNLILNARDAMGGTPGKIHVVARQARGTWLEITVTDTGPGFSEDALKHALDPFYSSKRNDEGSGLGLTMVYDFTQLSGGHTRIANSESGGGMVSLRLPLKFGPKPSAPQLVLLVEDSPEIRTDTREMLRDIGHSVMEAATAEEAETLAGIPGVTTVLTDIRLSGDRTGYDLARALRDGGNPARVFLMTSLPAKNTIRSAAAKEFPLIGKPFKLAELTSFLEQDAGS